MGLVIVVMDPRPLGESCAMPEAASTKFFALTLAIVQ
ncbi:hypothetical protein LINPERPRIM_LOCUS13818 [Linum perenne]